ncbi:hypothetical protein ACJ6WF_01665 [Streptomyces sp. MMS24-I2-30]|uniref:hypothetical protein n=1 Tax=Streptomyces sp. MMS24-I2-30 TaxID=3351564 RepID=UPI003896D9BE
MHTQSVVAQQPDHLRVVEEVADRRQAPGESGDLLEGQPQLPARGQSDGPADQHGQDGTQPEHP